MSDPRPDAPEEAEPRPAAVRTPRVSTARGVRLRSMSEEDLGFVVDQHRRYFPEGFFARLGRGFLREYYRGFLTSRAARTLVAERDGEPVGYLVGVTGPTAHRKHVVDRHGLRMVLRAAVAMLVRPWLALRFLRTRAGRYARKLLVTRRATGATQAAPTGPVGILTHVAVAQPAQSGGVGTVLVETFEQQAADAGCQHLVLVTAAGERGPGRFYRRRGWRDKGQHRTPDGQLLATYERHLDGPDDQDDQDGQGDTGRTGAQR